MTLFDIPLWQLAIAWGVTFLGALIQGSVGFGLAVISAPVLLMIAPEFVPGSLMTSALVLCSLIAFREREAIVPSEVAVSSVARLAATIPTAMLVGVIDQRAFSMIFAVAVLAAVGVSMSPYRLPFTHRNLAIASAISGITNTLTAIGGPPMALVYQGQKGSHLRATMSAIFTIGTLFSIVSLSVVGKFHGRDIVLGLLLLPGILSGFALSRYTTPWLDRQATRPAVLGVAALSATVILVRALWWYEVAQGSK